MTIDPGDFVFIKLVAMIWVMLIKALVFMEKTLENGLFRALITKMAHLGLHKSTGNRCVYFVRERWGHDKFRVKVG